MKLADLHIHSLYSDGSYSPAEILRRAAENGVGLISVCDHNVVQGTLETVKLAQNSDIRVIPGVEIDAMHEGTDIHILCYGADLADEALLGRIRHARAQLDQMSTDLLERMIPEYPMLSVNEYEAFPHNTDLGGWKLLQYFVAKGVTPDLKGGFPYYDRYGVTYAQAGFDSAEEIVRRIHAAGGRAVLAHPGVVFPTEWMSVFQARVHSALDLGMDGIECHYLRHSPEITRKCIEICRDRNLMITAGSDCHGAFNRNAIGQTHTRIDQLELMGLR